MTDPAGHERGKGPGAQPAARLLCNRTPANRWGDPGELIGALLFLASDASSYVNGQVIYVDGGLLASV